MRRYVTLSPGFWTGEAADWSVHAKVLYLWSWSNEHAHGLTAVYQVSERIIMAETGLAMEELEKARAEIGARIRWYADNWVWVVARARHALAGSNPNSITSVRHHLNDAPAQVQADFWQVYELIKEGGKELFRYRLKTCSPHANGVNTSQAVSVSVSESVQQRTAPPNPQLEPQQVGDERPAFAVAMHPDDSLPAPNEAKLLAEIDARDTPEAQAMRGNVYRFKEKCRWTGTNNRPIENHFSKARQAGYSDAEIAQWIEKFGQEGDKPWELIERAQRNKPKPSIYKLLPERT